MTGPSSGDRPAEETCACGHRPGEHDSLGCHRASGDERCWCRKFRLDSPAVRTGDDDGDLMPVSGAIMHTLLVSKHPPKSWLLAGELARAAAAALSTSPPVSGTATRDDVARALYALEDIAEDWPFSELPEHRQESMRRLADRFLLALGGSQLNNKEKP